MTYAYRPNGVMLADQILVYVAEWHNKLAVHVAVTHIGLHAS